MLLDLQDEPLANAYVVASGLFLQSDRRIDYFVVCEHPGIVHFVSGERARAERDRLELDRPPGLRVSTMHKGLRRSRDATWRARAGIDLSYLTLRRPCGESVDCWIDAHPYLVKGMWREGIRLDAALVRSIAGEIGDCMQNVLERYGWRDADRRVYPSISASAAK